MSMTYDSLKVTPCPLVEIRKQIDTNEDGTTLGNTYQLVLKGKLVAHKGSPTSSGTWNTGPGDLPEETLTPDQKLRSILRKQQALRELFARQGKSLEIQPWDGSAPIKCNPRVLGISFPEGIWVEVCDYQIDLEADVLYGPIANESELSHYLRSASEEWTVEPQEDGRTWRLSHTLEAQGKRHYDETGTVLRSAHEEARAWVQTRMGLDSSMLVCSGVLDGNGLSAYDYRRTQASSTTAGTFRVNENWVAVNASGEAPVIEEYTVDVRTDQDGRNAVTIQGSIQGLEARDNSTYALLSDRWTNASSKWTSNVQPILKTRAEQMTGLTLRATPQSTQVSYNRVAGTINYDWSYDDSCVNSDYRRYRVEITDDHAADVFAKLPVPGRVIGPVLQGLSTVTAKSRTIQIEIQKQAEDCDTTYAKPDTSAAVLNYWPAGYSQIFVERNVEQYSPTEGTYSRTLVLVYQ